MLNLEPEANWHLIIGKIASRIRIHMYGIQLIDKTFQLVQSSQKPLPKSVIKSQTV